MPANHTTSADVSGLSAVNSASDGADFVQGLHRSRAREVFVGNVIGTATAISTVFVARQLAPQTLLAGELALAKRFSTSAEAARKSLNTALMLTSGLCSGIASQTIFARKRRQSYDVAEDVSVGRDVTRLLTGWSFGSFGASASYFLAESYAPQLLRGAEQVLDGALKSFEYVPHNKLSESLIANAAMTVGAIPANVLGQRLYDALLVHPAFEKQKG